jgi:hypothetical protein
LLGITSITKPPAGTGIRITEGGKMNIPLPKESLERTYPELDLAEDPNPRIEQTDDGAVLTIDCVDGLAFINLTHQEALDLLDALLGKG